MKRRTLLKASLLPLALGGMLSPGKAFSAYPGKAFRARETAEALREAFGTADIAQSGKIEIEAPLVARDAGMVPVRVRSGFDNTESISLMVSGNEAPFTAHFRLHQPQGFVSTRVRVADTSDLLVIVKADGVLYTNKRLLRVGRHCTI